MFTVNVYIKGADKASYIKSTFNILKSEFKKINNIIKNRTDDNITCTEKERKFIMRNRKIIAFITSLTMLFGCQSVLVSAEEITDTQPGISQKDEQNPRENPELKSMVEVTMEYTGCTEDEAWDAVIKEWDLDNIKEFGNSFNKILKHLEDLGYEVSYLDETPLEDSENTRVKGMIDGMEYYDIIEINGRTYYDMGSAYYSGDELISLSATDAVARPGTRTYVDISFDGPADLNAFLIQLTYDKNALKLISASVKEEFNEVSDEAEYEYEDEEWETFTYNPEEAILLYLRNDLTPIDLSSENTVRLCFEVSEDAEEKNMRSI